MKNIRSILQFLLAERKQYLTASGEPSLEYLRDMPTEEVKKELLRFKGVGPKTVSCVLMFNLHR
jgi:3-methyladenine DNA glycosylase/8-oxoguanine DNA glycosylase